MIMSWRLGTLAAVFVSIHPCVCQTVPDSPATVNQVDATAFQAFFSQVAEAATPASQRITPQEAMGLTDVEAQALHELAAGFTAESQRLAEAARRLTFESRLRTMASQEVPATVAQRLKELNDERRKVILDHVQRLRTELGASRFEAVESFIQAREKSNAFFPLRDDPSRPKKKSAPKPQQ